MLDTVWNLQTILLKHQKRWVVRNQSLGNFCCFWHVPTLVSIATLQDCSGQLSSCRTGEVFAAWWECSLPHSSPFHPPPLSFFFSLLPSDDPHAIAKDGWKVSVLVCLLISNPRHAHINLAHQYSWSLDLNLLYLPSHLCTQGSWGGNQHLLHCSWPSLPAYQHLLCHQGNIVMSF